MFLKGNLPKSEWDIINFVFKNMDENLKQNLWSSEMHNNEMISYVNFLLEKYNGQLEAVYE